MPPPTQNKALFMFSCTRLEYEYLKQTHKRGTAESKRTINFKSNLSIYLISILSYFQFTLPRQINGISRPFLTEPQKT